MAIGPKVWSEPLIKESNFAINGRVYLEKCVQKRLIPYIRTHYDDNYVFWQDNVSAHYAKVVVEHLELEGTHFFTKEDNPANIPEARYVEYLWALLKSRDYVNAWGAKNTHQLTNRIRLWLRQMDAQIVQRLVEST